MYSLSEAKSEATYFFSHQLEQRKSRHRKNPKTTRANNGTAEKNVCIYVRGKLVGMHVS